MATAPIGDNSKVEGTENDLYQKISFLKPKNIKKTTVNNTIAFATNIFIKNCSQY